MVFASSSSVIKPRHLFVQFACLSSFHGRHPVSFRGHLHNIRKLCCFSFLPSAQFAFRFGVLLPCFVSLHRSASLFVQTPQRLLDFTSKEHFGACEFKFALELFWFSVLFSFHFQGTQFLDRGSNRDPFSHNRIFHFKRFRPPS